MRITQKMWRTRLLGSINQSYNQMAGVDLRRRITTASDDPAGTEHMLRLRALLATNQQYQANVSSASRWLTYSESAVAAAAQDIRAAHELALTAADSSNDLAGMTEALDNLIDDLLNQANAQQGGRYLFGGSQGRQAPFVREGNTVTYRGDDLELGTAISAGLSLRYNLPGSVLFGDQTARFAGSGDWDPVSTWATPLEQLFDGSGLDAGRVRLTDGAGETAVVDLRGATTLGELRQRIETALPALRVSLVDGERLEIRDDLNPGGQVTIEDVQGGHFAAVLGLVNSGSGGALRSRDLDPAFTDATPLSELRGVTLPLGSVDVVVDGGDPPTTVDLSGAVTVGDLRGLLNAVSGVSATIGASGNRLEISGVGPVSVEIRDLDGDATASRLGLTGSAVPVRPFGALLDLREAVANGDRARVRALLPELEALEDHFTGARGTLGNRLNLAEDAQSTLETRNFNMTAALSEVGDADMTEALMQYQSAESVYQASLLMASNIFQMTLSNYL